MIGTLTTTRLTLRPLTPDDAVHFARLLGNDSESVQMMATMPDPCTEEAAREWIVGGKGLAGYKFAIIRTGDDEFLGIIGAGRNDDSLTLGYFIGRPFWNHGYASEAVTAFLKFARSLGVKKILADTFYTNDSSGKVLLKNGFTMLGQVEENCPQRGGMRKLNKYELDLTVSADTLPQ